MVRAVLLYLINQLPMTVVVVITEPIETPKAIVPNAK